VTLRQIAFPEESPSIVLSVHTVKPIFLYISGKLKMNICIMKHFNFDYLITANLKIRVEAQQLLYYVRVSRQREKYIHKIYMACSRISHHRDEKSKNFLIDQPHQLVPINYLTVETTSDHIENLYIIDVSYWRSSSKRMCDRDPSSCAHQSPLSITLFKHKIEVSIEVLLFR
jgi:hypothetical protein